MTASTVMNPNPTILRDTDSVKHAVRYIMEKRYRNLPVVDANGRYLGVFGVNCLLKMLLPKAVIMELGLENVSFMSEGLADLKRRLVEAEDLPVTHCLTDEATVVRPDTQLMEALLALYTTRTSVPVVEKDSGRLVGMISYWDVGEKVLAIADPPAGAGAGG